MGINRNIVECKVLNVLDLPEGFYCINRNIVECKVILLIASSVAVIVLIETLWNVK